MTKLNEHRNTTRLHIDKGLVMLRNGTHPPIACSLVDLSAGGCHCKAVPGTIEAATFAEWKELINPGTKLEVELSRPPNFLRLKLQAAVSHVDRLGDNSMEMGISFKDVEPAAQKALEHALVSIAADKIRHKEPHETPEKPAAKSADVASNNAPPMPAAQTEHDVRSHGQLGEIIVRTNLLTPEALADAERRAKASHQTLIRYLLREHLVKPGELCRAVSLSASLPITDLGNVEISKDVLKMFTYLTMLRYEFIPFSESKELLCIAAIAPLSIETLNELTRICGHEILVFIAPADQIRRQLFRMRPRDAFKDREKMRIRAHAPVDFELANKSGINMDDDHHHGETVDVSETGFLVEAPPLEKYSIEQLLETEHFVRIALHCGSELIHAYCCIRHIESVPARDSRRPLWHIGLQIRSIDPEDAAKLHDSCVETVNAQLASRKKGY